MKGGTYSSPLTFSEHIALSPFVYLYGGFTGSGSNRGNYTTLDGTNNGRVLTIRGGYGVNTVDNFSIIRGSVTSGNGGGIFCSNASPVIRYNRIRSNTASGSPSYGGGIYCYYGAPIIEGNYIGEQSAGNSALYGAGLYSYCSIVTIARNAIWYNTSGCSQGGGIYAIANLADNYGTVLIENNFIKGNVTSDAGCGMYISGCGNYSNSLIVAYNTITGNGSTYSASGAVYLVSPDYIVFADNIVSSNNLNGNTYGIRKSGGASISITRNCVYSNGGTDYSTGITHSTDINVSPQLGTMWWLQSGSPCRTNASPPGYTTSIDIDGESRKMGAVYDIGCDEYTE